MKHPILLLLVLFSLSVAPSGCTTAQRASVASAADRVAPVFRKVLGYINLALGFVPASPMATVARVAANAADAIVGVYESTRATSDRCRAWVALYGALGQSVVSLDALPDVPDVARSAAKRATAALYESMPSSCREVQAALGPEVAPGTEDGGILDDAGNAIQGAVVEDRASNASVRSLDGGASQGDATVQGDP